MLAGTATHLRQTYFSLVRRRTASKGRQCGLTLSKDDEARVSPDNPEGQKHNRIQLKMMFQYKEFLSVQLNRMARNERFHPNKRTDSDAQLH